MTGVLDGLATFDASRQNMPAPGGATTDLIAGAGLAGFDWTITQPSTYCGFFTDGAGVRRWGFTQGGIYAIYATAQLTIQNQQYAELNLTLPTPHPVLRRNVSDFQTGKTVGISTIACIPDEGGWLSLQLLRSNDPTDPSNASRRATVTVHLREIVPRDGFPSTGAQAPTTVPVITAAARNTGMRFA